MSGTLRTAALDLPRIAGHGVRRRLPDARAPHRRRRTARAATTRSYADPGDPGSPVRDRLARRAGTTRSSRRSARSTTSTRSSPRPATLGMEVALDIALQCSPGPPVGDRAPGVVHHAGRRHDRVRGEPAEEVPGHLPAELRQRPRGHLHRDPPGPAGVDRPRRDAVPRRQPAHQAARLLGADPGSRCAPTTPTSSSCPRRSRGRP